PSSSDPPPVAPRTYTLSLHDALPIFLWHATICSLSTILGRHVFVCVQPHPRARCTPWGRRLLPSIASPQYAITRIINCSGLIPFAASASFLITVGQCCAPARAVMAA